MPRRNIGTAVQSGGVRSTTLAIGFLGDAPVLLQFGQRHLLKFTLECDFIGMIGVDELDAGQGFLAEHFQLLAGFAFGKSRKGNLLLG